MMLEFGKRYSIADIRRLLKVRIDGLFVKRGSRIVCLAFARKYNPEAPSIILVGTGRSLSPNARLFAQQKGSVPTFIKMATDDWEFLGNYYASGISLNPDMLAEYQERAGRTGALSAILFLKLDFLSLRISRP